MVELVPPVTRFRVALLVSGWRKITLLPTPTSKLVQLTIARVLAWSTLTAPPPPDIVAVPEVTAPPVGKSDCAKAGAAKPMRAVSALVAIAQRKTAELIE